MPASAPIRPANALVASTRAACVLLLIGVPQRAHNRLCIAGDSVEYVGYVKSRISVYHKIYFSECVVAVEGQRCSNTSAPGFTKS